MKIKLTNDIIEKILIEKLASFNIKTLKHEWQFALNLGRKFRFDFALIESKIAIEIEGGIWTNGRHIRPEGYIKDMEKYDLACDLDWLVYRFTPDDAVKPENIQRIVNKHFQRKRKAYNNLPKKVNPKINRIKKIYNVK